MSDFDSTSSSINGDKELQEFLMIEKQKAQVNAQVSSLTTSNHVFIGLQQISW